MTATLAWTPLARADAALFPTSNYNSPSVSSDGQGGMVIDVPNPPAGVYFTAPLQEGHTYRLRVDGQPSEGTFSLRLRIDGGAFDYRPADGAVVVRVSGNATLEALIYSDSGGSYTVDSITLEDCAGTCLGNDDLRAEVLADTPGLSDALAAGDTYLAARLINQWAMPRIPWAGPGSTDLNATPYAAAALYYDYFKPRLRGVFCGGAALFLKRLLDIFGIESFPLLFGDRNGDLTHMTVIVEEPDESGAARFRIIDPTFDLAPTVRATERVLSVAEMLEIWRAGLSDQMDLGNSRVDNRPVLMGSGTQPSEVECSSFDAVEGGCRLADWALDFAPALQSFGYTRSPAYLDLLGTAFLYDTSGLGVPDDFVRMHDDFKSATLNGDETFHLVSPLPLPPVADRRPNLTRAPAPDAPMQVIGWTWDERVPARDTRVTWWKCDQGGGRCEIVSGVTAYTYVVPDADWQKMFKVTISASNTFGATSTSSDLISGAPIVGRPVIVAPETLSERTASPPSASDTSADGPRAQRRLRVSTRVLITRRSRVVVVRLLLRSDSFAIVRVMLKSRTSPQPAVQGPLVALRAHRVRTIRIRLSPDALAQLWPRAHAVVRKQH